ncbi:MAG TPA: TMEM14 family protein [Candidatus Binatia bacterium]|nr:TMEM14 family protein [Candidatus Binatia bacterium]
MLRPDVILWIYIVLLVVGGLMGFLKAGSKVSLIVSVSAAAILTLCQIRVVFEPRMADIVLAILLVVFAWRLGESKKFMPAGLMLILTIATLVLRHVRI